MNRLLETLSRKTSGFPSTWSGFSESNEGGTFGWGEYVVKDFGVEGTVGGSEGCTREIYQRCGRHGKSQKSWNVDSMRRYVCAYIIWRT